MITHSFKSPAPSQLVLLCRVKEQAWVWGPSAWFSSSAEERGWKASLKIPEPTVLPGFAGVEAWITTPYWQWWGCQVISLQSQVLLSEQLRQGTIHWPEIDGKLLWFSFYGWRLLYRKPRIQWWTAHHCRDHSRRPHSYKQENSAWLPANQTESHQVVFWNNTVHATSQCKFCSVKTHAYKKIKVFGYYSIIIYFQTVHEVFHRTASL